MTPPIADPTRIPARAGSTPSAAPSFQASRAAATASTTFRSSRRASFGPTTSTGSKSFTSDAMRTGNPPASKERMKSTPERPAIAASHVDRASWPSGVTAPKPVTATRRIGGRA